MRKIVYVVNVEGSADDLATNYGYDSWINYWYAKNRRINFRHCPNRNCGKKITDNNKIVGAHVYKCSHVSSEDCIVYTDKIFIAPICRTCNGEEGFDAKKVVEQDVYTMMIYEGHLVPHPKYKNKK